MNDIRVITADLHNITDFPLCGYKNRKQEGYKRKVEWLKKRFEEGMLYKVLYSEKDGVVGNIEYIPGQYAWRPVDAAGYMFIHCIVIMKKPCRDRGYGSLLLEECIRDARSQELSGVAVVTSKGTWMAGKDLFLKHGFHSVDKAPPGFELMALKFDEKSPSPRFRGDWNKRLEALGAGLTIITSDQCPFIVKSFNEIVGTAREEYGLEPKIIHLQDWRQAQETPCAYGIFNMVYDGKLYADHPVSGTRFRNIMEKEIKIKTLEK